MSRTTNGSYSLLHCHCGVSLTEENKVKGKGAECKNCSNLRKQTERKKRQIKYQWAAVEMLGGKCENCEKEATKETMVCFDFHHVIKEDKVDTIGNMVGNSRPLKVILEEAEKCVLLCACCHRLHHQKYGY